MTVKVVADSFLQRMVRNIVALLLCVGRGRIASEEVPHLLALRDRSKLPVATAPPQGLFLVDVEYALDRQCGAEESGKETKSDPGSSRVIGI